MPPRARTGRSGRPIVLGEVTEPQAARASDFESLGHVEAGRANAFRRRSSIQTGRHNNNRVRFDLGATASDFETFGRSRPAKASDFRGLDSETTSSSDFASNLASYGGARAQDFKTFSQSTDYSSPRSWRHLKSFYRCFVMPVENFCRRVIPFIGYHHVLMLLIAVSIILLSFLLAGCSSSSPGIDNIFLISMYYKNYVPYMDPTQVDTSVFSSIANIVGRAQLEVRVGYFGVCVSSNGGGFLCSNNASALAQQVAVDQDPLNLIYVANTFKNSIVFPYLLIIAIIFAFVCFLLLATFPGWHEEVTDDDETRDVKPFPSRPVSQVALALIFVASVFVLVSVLWQHTASISASQVVQDLGNGSILSGVGSSALALGWVSFGLLVLVTIGLLAMILSISVLTNTLVDDE